MSAILADTGPLVALLDSRDADHATCVEAARAIRDPLVTSWAVLTETVYLLGPDTKAQAGLLRKVESGDIGIPSLDAGDVPDIRSLLSKYRDLPMDLADATLVHLGNREGINRVFTLDGDFRVYRLKKGRAFTIVP